MEISSEDMHDAALGAIYHFAAFLGSFVAFFLKLSSNLPLSLIRHINASIIFLSFCYSSDASVESGTCFGLVKAEIVTLRSFQRQRPNLKNDHHRRPETLLGTLAQY